MLLTTVSFYFKCSTIVVVIMAQYWVVFGRIEISIEWYDN